jgi:hypothetical protein
MYAALPEIDYTLVGWSWMLWDFNWGDLAQRMRRSLAFCGACTPATSW